MDKPVGQPAVQPAVRLPVLRRTPSCPASPADPARPAASCSELQPSKPRLAALLVSFDRLHHSVQPALHQAEQPRRFSQLASLGRAAYRPGLGWSFGTSRGPVTAGAGRPSLPCTLLICATCASRSLANLTASLTSASSAAPPAVSVSCRARV